MAINIGSEASCRKAYLNYHCYGNTMGIKPEEMGQITQVWEDRLESWQKTVSQDVNEYEFDDSDFEKYHDQGFDEAKETTGHNGKTGGMIARGTVDAVTCLGSGVGNYLGNTLGKKAASKVAAEVVESVTVEVGKDYAVSATVTEATKGFGKKLINESIDDAVKKAAKETAGEAAEKAAEKAAKETTEEAAEKAAESTVKNAAEGAGEAASKKIGEKIGWMIGCTMGAATAATYFIQKPNKDGKEACDKLQNEMVGAQSALDETQTDMQSAAGEITTLADKANEVNEEANITIQNHKTEYDSYMNSINYLKQKAESGQQLSDSEKDLYKILTAEAKESSTAISETPDKVTDEVTTIYDEIGTYQENYDLAAENIGQIEGLTDFAEGIDQTTQTMCYVEAAAQGINVASSGTAAVQAALSGGFVGWAFAALGAAGAAGSVVAANEQGQWGNEVGTEIEMRKVTQDLNTATSDIYTEEIDSYAGMLQGVEDLKVDVPNDIEPPTDTSLPENNLVNESSATANQNTKTNFLFSTSQTKSEEENSDKKVKKNEKEEKA